MEENSKTPYIGDFRGRKFIFDQEKMDNYIVPDLTGFNVLFSFIINPLFI